MGAVVTAACAGPGGTSLPWSTGRQIQIEALPGANEDSPVRVDILLVYSETVLAVVPKTAPEWFAGRAVLQHGFADDLAVVSMELVPATTSAVPLPKRHGKPVAVLSFADYRGADGQSVGDLTRFECVRITLGAAKASYAACE